jgi:F-type H+-transporting ATPase subunit epsilon
MLNVVIISPEKIIFEGQAEKVILPGEQGTFEVLTFHKNLLSRLLSGSVIVDGRTFSIQRGIVKVKDNTVTIISEGI